jgi:hypothetical protein
MSESISLPIKRIVEGVMPIAANHFVIQRTEHEYILYFFDLQAPLLIGTQEENRKEAELLEYVEARCVAKIVIADGRMGEFVELINKNSQLAVAGTQQDE